MSWHECRREHCDGLTQIAGGLCAFHASPPDEDLRAQYERPWPTRAYVVIYDDDRTPMSSQEKYLHPEAE